MVIVRPRRDGQNEKDQIMKAIRDDLEWPREGFMSEETNKQEELREKREARRKRRQRNQILAYLVVLIVVVLLAIGILALINHVSKMPQKDTNPPQVSTETAEIPSEETEPEESSSEPEETSTEPEETEPVVVEPTIDEKLDEIVDAALKDMTLEEKVAGLFIVTPEILTGVKTVTRAGDSTKAALAKYAVGGLLYRTQNVKNKETFLTMLENTAQYSKYPLFLAVEEEGGDVAPLVKAKLGEKTNDAKTIAATGDPQNAYQRGVTIGKYLKEIGFNLNLSPVADLVSTEKSLMEKRSYGSETQAVLPYVTSEMKGLQEQGITPCVKHFPGMGSLTASADPEKTLAVSDREEVQFWANEMELFHALCDEKVPIIMISNMGAPSLTEEGNLPCVFSEKVVNGILRQQFGYNGLIITDCLNEYTISKYYSADQAAIQALKAGCDVILCPEDLDKAYQGVLQAVQNGTISQDRINDSLRRIYRIKLAHLVEE